MSRQGNYNGSFIKKIAVISNNTVNFNHWLQENGQNGNDYVCVTRLDQVMGVIFDEIEYSYFYSLNPNWSEINDQLKSRRNEQK